MLDFLRFWMPMVAAVLLLLVFICGYVEAIYSSWRPGSLPASSPIPDELATTIASIIGTIVVGTFGFNLAISTPDGSRLGMRGAQEEAVAPGAESFKTKNTARTTAAIRATAKVLTPQGITTSAAIKDTIASILIIVYMATGLACLVTLIWKRNHIPDKVKALALTTFSIMITFLTAMFVV